MINKNLFGYEIDTVVPPLKTQGIKTKLIPLIYQFVPKNFDGVWIEPFIGSGVVGFNIANKKAIFSDINPHVISFYNATKNKKIDYKIVRDFLEEEGEKLSKNEEYYYEVRERFNTYFNPLDFLFLNRACFNGVIRFNKKGKFNTPFCKKKDRFSKSYITKIVNQVKKVQELIINSDWSFFCKDFSKVIPLAKEGDLIYCDPPYIDRHTNYYDNWNEDKEKNLYLLLKNSNANFILSTWYKNRYRENQFLNKLWKEFYIVYKEHFYYVGAKESNRNSIIEVLVMKMFFCA